MLLKKAYFEYNQAMTITISKFKKYEDKWIAYDTKGEEVVASGKNISMVQKKAEKSKKKNIILKYIYPFNTRLAP